MNIGTVRHQAGAVLVTQEFGPTLELPTLQCVHCGCHWLVEPGSGIRRGWCMNCAGPHCGAHDCTVRCVPTERMLEQIERQAAKATRGY